MTFEDDLTATLHDTWEWQYDQCDHGKYMGGPSAGEPYEMCRIFARRLVRSGIVRPAQHEPPRELIDAVAHPMMAAWETAEGEPVNVSYVSTFADMARAVIDDDQLLDRLAQYRDRHVPRDGEAAPEPRA